MESKFIIDEYKLDRKDYLTLEKIKQGGFDNVISILNVKTQTYYVAKVLDRNKFSQDMINQEISLRVKANHSTINKFIGYFEYNIQTVLLVMEKSSNNSLFDYLKENYEIKSALSLDNTSRQIILVGITYGMMLLHKNNIYHKSLTPESILHDKNFNPYITDFEFEKPQSREIKIPIYTPPECFEKKYFTEKSDVYSFGIIMYQIITNKNPFPQILNGKMSKENFIDNVINKGLRPQIPSDVKRPFSELLQNCWSSNPEERPSFKEIYQKLYHDYNYYLDGVDMCELIRYVSKIEIDAENEEYLTKLHKNTINSSSPRKNNLKKPKNEKLNVNN